MELSTVNKTILDSMFTYFPTGYDTSAARLLLLTIGLQESRFQYRAQLGGGPARGFWQFEEGNEKSKGGVWGVLNHYRVGPLAKQFCRQLGIAADPKTVWRAMETNDVLAAGFARLLLLADAKALPKVGAVEDAWECYAKRTWRPGKPHRATWDGFYAQARKELGV
ncbi:hypothetical protein HWB52_gp87 [Pseudomonas phage Littlefix]|uniref:Uncharacterized protein n=1 Tax=Pseudomonas phage Littlefix TaxID=2079289 RepID=A0A2K9VHZ3_9CAUD|nr:hypothetical protein HWB52_gp87 [Pseudomonas phage Littlefix]AUV61902.1 hypothetical protein PsPhLittlefix_gp87 [Pseudomonas phage Littlefix]